MLKIAVQKSGISCGTLHFLKKSKNLSDVTAGHPGAAAAIEALVLITHTHFLWSDRGPPSILHLRYRDLGALVLGNYMLQCQVDIKIEISFDILQEFLLNIDRLLLSMHRLHFEHPT